MRQYADRTEEAALLARSDPRRAFRDHVSTILGTQADDLAFSDVLLDPSGASRAFRDEIGRALTATLELVELARDAGVVRPDFDHTDLLALLHANTGLVRGAGADAPEASRRFAALVLQAFETPGETLPTPAAWGRPR